MPPRPEHLAASILGQNAQVEGALIAKAASAMAVYDIVYFSSMDDDHPVATKADADTLAHTRQPLFIVLAADVIDAYITVRPVALLSGVNTNGATQGDPVYLSTTAGGWTLTAPTNPRTVGIVMTVDATAGQILFWPSKCVQIGNLGVGLFPDGAVGAPGISFLADPDNGFYRTGANAWSAAVGGVKVLGFTGTALVVPVQFDQDVTLAAAGDAYNLAVTSGHATGTIDGIDLTVTQDAQAVRTSGSVAGIKVTMVSGASDSGGTFNDIELLVTDGGGVVTHNAIKIGAGFDALLDCSAAATGQNDVVMPDNVASAFEFREAANVYFRFCTTNSAEAIESLKRLTTTDGVASGTARVVGGRAACITAAGASHTGSTTETVLASYSIPADTIKVGTVIRVRGMARVTADNGATTLTCKLLLGTTTLLGTALITSGAVDTSAGHVFVFDFTLVGRAAPGATSAVVGFGTFQQPGAVGGAMISATLNTTDFATNGALLLELTADWSAADANAVQAEIFIVEVTG